MIYSSYDLVNTTSRIKIIPILLFLLINSSLVSCKKILDAKPSTDTVVEGRVFVEDEASIAAMSGIYASMSGTTTAAVFSARDCISLFAGLSADEFTLASNVTNAVHIGYYRNALSAATAPLSGSETWPALYTMVFRCNSVIDNLSNPAAEVLTPGVRQQLLGEARFVRALCYFYLVNMYGDLPLVTELDPFVNIKLSRSSKSTIYSFIITELKEAKKLLSVDFQNASLNGVTTERVRPTRWAASALLARTYLYNQEYALAETEASEVIANTGLFDIVPLNNVFLKNAKEAIWQLQSTRAQFNTYDAVLYVIPNTGPGLNQPVYLSNGMLSAFEAGDKRATPGNWINTITVSGTTYTFPFKYKLSAMDATITAATGTQNMKEYHTVIRLGELYLIRAEARAQLGNIADCRADLLVIRRRAGLADATLTANDQASLLNAVIHERRVELFSEYGHRWFDLKRTGRLDAVMTIATPQKSNGLTTWEPFRQLFPLPQGDVDKALNVAQNPGY